MNTEQGKKKNTSEYQNYTDPGSNFGLGHFEVEQTLVEVFSTENTSIKVD